jgi:hypothetical protein
VILSRGKGARQSRFALVIVVLTVLITNCSKDMQEQPSYQSQEAPRKHSPSGSIPRDSRAVLPGAFSLSKERLHGGARLFAINCAHCHGSAGEGDGPVAGYLRELPKNLRSPYIQKKPEAELYDIITKGRDIMPAFQGYLSTEERWVLAHYVKMMSAE